MPIYHVSTLNLSDPLETCDDDRQPHIVHTHMPPTELDTEKKKYCKGAMSSAIFCGSDQTHPLYVFHQKLTKAHTILENMKKSIFSAK